MFLREFVCEYFSGGFFVRNSLEGILCLRRQSYLNMEGIYLFIKILVFVKILSQKSGEEEGKTRNLDP